MSQNWMRHFELQILAENGQGISLSDFRVTFTLNWTDTRWPRVGLVKIFNLSGDTASRILGQEFARIKLIAGYDGIAPTYKESDVGVVKPIDADQIGKPAGANFGEIFTGDIRFTVTGRDSPTDTWIMVQAIDSHQAFMYGNVSKTLSKGYRIADVHSAALDSYRPFGITQGVTGDMAATVYPRGRVLYQSTRDIMDNVAVQCHSSWQLSGHQLQMVPENKYVHQAVILSSLTGLIGMPQQTINGGINVRCLINPNIQLNGLIQVDQASVYRASLSNEDIRALPSRANEDNINGNLTVNGLQKPPASIATDGVYIVKSIDYAGDTRGKDWYMNMMCFARGDATLHFTEFLNRGS